MLPTSSSCQRPWPSCRKETQFRGRKGTLPAKSLDPENEGVLIPALDGRTQAATGPIGERACGDRNPRKECALTPLRTARPRAEYPVAPFRPAAIAAAPHSWRRGGAPQRTLRQSSPSNEAALPRLLYSKSEVATMLGVSDSHIDNLVKAGQLKPTYVGSRKKHFSVEAVQAFIAAGAQPREMRNEGLE